MREILEFFQAHMIVYDQFLFDEAYKEALELGFDRKICNLIKSCFEFNPEADWEQVEYCLEALNYSFKSGL